MIKLVLSDVDGTLIPLGAGRASQRTMEAIRRVQDAGVHMGVATGRDVMELRQLFGGDDVAFRTGILSNGKKIMVDGELAQLMLLENEGLQRLAEMVVEYPNTFVTIYPLQTDETNPVYCVGVGEEEIAHWSEVYAFRGICVPRVPDEDVIGATIACPQNQGIMDEIKARGSELCPQFDFTQPAPHWCDILPHGVNKGTALQWLAKLLGVGWDEVVVFGDADNDLALLSAVENSVAVAGASPAATAAATWHIGTCEDEAVADALDQIAQCALEGGTPAFMRGA